MILVQEHKEPQHNLKTEKFLTPKRLSLALSQHAGEPSTPCVSLGQEIKEAQNIATSSGYISSPLHAPCDGKIIAIEIGNHPVLRKSECITIQCQANNKGYPSLIKNIENTTKESLLKDIKDAGIVGLGGAAFPAHVKLNPPKKIDTIVINGCECEPYLSTDNRMMIENLTEIFKGIEIIAKIIEPNEIIFAIESNKPEAIKKLNLFINTKKFGFSKIRLSVLKTAYPQGGEKQLIFSTTNRKVEPGKLPLDIGCLVQNVATAFAIYEAVYLKKPLIERLVSFCGDALLKPKNVWVKIGTSLQELFDEKILEFKEEPKKVISGGPMMGVCLDNLNYPILKGSGGFLFLSSPVSEEKEYPCIRCARCIDACPMNLLPLEYAKIIKKEKYNLLTDLSIKDCIECGCCAWVCPSKIPLVHYVKIGKKYEPKNI